MEEKGKQVAGVDILRVILAFFVTVLHIKPTLSVNENITFYITNAITRTGVPGFFFITGYLYSIRGKDFGDKAVVFKHMKRMAVLYCAWTVVIFPIIIADFMNNPKYEGMGILFKGAIFVRRFFLIGSYTPLWFFLAGIYATGMIFVLEKFRISKYLILALLACFTFLGACLNDCYVPIGSVLFGSYEELAATMDQWHRYVGTIWKEAVWGAFYMYLGYLMQERITGKGPDRKRWMALAVFTVLLVGETALLKHFGAVEFSKMITVIPVVVILMSIFCSLENPWQGNVSLRKVSVLIYGFHIFTSYFLSDVLLENSLLRYGANMAVTLLLSVFVLKLSDKIKWLRVLY